MTSVGNPNLNQIAQTTLYDPTNHQTVAWQADPTTINTDSSVTPPVTYGKAATTGGAGGGGGGAVTDVTVSGTLTANNQAVTATFGAGVASWLVDARGTFNAGSTLNFEFSSDNTNWQPAYGVSVGSTGDVAVNSVAGGAAVQYQGNAAGFQYFRVRVSPFNAGDSITIKIVGSVATDGGFVSKSLPPGSNKIGGVTIADGDAATIGALADAAVTGDNSGSLSAKLRGLTKILADIWDSVNHRIKVDGSGVTQPVSGTVNAALQVAGSNVSISNPSFNDCAARQGPVNITTAGGTSGGTSPQFTGTCTASADNSVTFASQCRTVMLHNQSSVNVPFELDVAAVATSPYIAPGQLMILDIHTTTVHLYPSNALPINAASGLIVRGWN